MIEVRNVNKSFNGQQVLFDINHQFETGKVNLIIGQSGQGKSVLAKCIVGLYEVDDYLYKIIDNWKGLYL